MKPYSIARRVVWLVLAVELVAALVVTGFAFVYERHAQFRSFDIALRGRADSVLAAVQDSDDTGTGVTLDTADLHVPQRDLYAVREDRHLSSVDLGHSSNWTGLADSVWNAKDGYVTFTQAGRQYRGLRLRGLRVVDPGSDNVRHQISVIYAAPAGETWEAVFEAVRVFAIANALLLMATALLVPWVVRRSIRPLRLLAAQAGAVSAEAWEFHPGDELRRVAELAPLVDALEGVLQRLERSFAQQRQFVSDGAHELKTAVAVVKSSVQLLGMKARTADEYRQGLERCQTDCERMEALAQKMLLLARVEESPGPGTDLRTPLIVGLDSTLEELEPLARLRSVTLQRDVIDRRAATDGRTAEGEFEAAIEPEMWRSVLVNVILNAVQHSPARGVVRVTLGTAGKQIVCTVSDEGVGVTPEMLPLVFDRFFRGDPSRSRSTGGTGLGLAICKAILERAGGTIAMTAGLTGGTVVTLTLPESPTAQPPPGI